MTTEVAWGEQDRTCSLPSSPFQPQSAPPSSNICVMSNVANSGRNIHSTVKGYHSTVCLDRCSVFLPAKGLANTRLGPNQSNLDSRVHKNNHMQPAARNEGLIEREASPDYSGLGRWKLVERVGDGAFSRVYRAKDNRKQIPDVAIKIIPKPGTDQSQVCRSKPN